MGRNRSSLEKGGNQAPEWGQKKGERQGSRENIIQRRASVRCRQQMCSPGIEGDGKGNSLRSVFAASQKAND